MVERLLHWYGDAYGLRWAPLRYFNAAGADHPPLDVADFIHFVNAGGYTPSF
jgi:UDP-glucose 4-epimerase